MPQDSLYMVTANGDTIYTLNDSLLKTLPPGLLEAIANKPEEEPTLTQPAIFVVALFVILLLSRVLYKVICKYLIYRKPIRVGEEHRQRYHQILQAGNPYYRKLSPDLQLRFLDRTLKFIDSKHFHFIDLTEEERMPLLIGSVAVQISFGLENYLMEYFKNIYVLRSNYHFGLSNIPFEGHVSSQGIYLSWSNFEKAFDDYNDGNNVGLHEMAHALTYVNFVAREGEDGYFRKRFKKFSKVGRAIFNEMQNGKRNMLGSYAATNYHEFWAVSIEHFFERPELMKSELPDLYLEMCQLLKQDLTSPKLLIDSDQ